jgi:hypothetical protein
MSVRLPFSCTIFFSEAEFFLETSLEIIKGVGKTVIAEIFRTDLMPKTKAILRYDVSAYLIDVLNSRDNRKKQQLCMH